ncbi:ion channel [Saccharospirillum impatiens]|uniref:ion channel n=1 Tax=Saccharospirillum impatiens TaxID=169438 RepID=UPI000421D9FD|nr:ion channel [Saccharospirillum impatiens]
MLIPSEVGVTVITILVVGFVVVFHYEVVQVLNRLVVRRVGRSEGYVRDRPFILTVMFTLLLAHVVEIWLFGAAFYLLLSHGGYGAITGYDEVSFLDCVYFSAGNFTTSGWGDLAARGDIRFLAGTEALVGFMVITWSASFGYLVMARTLPGGSAE